MTEHILILQGYIDHLEYMKKNADDFFDREQADKDIEAFKAAIKALEQEPCEDAISRESLLLWLDDIKESARKHIGFLLDVQRHIRSMPSVNLQPCEDAISREATLKPYNGLNDEDTISVWLIRKNIEQQPPVNPQVKTGHWIEERNDYGEVTGWHCDKCYEDSGFTTTCKWDFCPSCGAMMIEPQESEVSDADSD